MLATTLAIQPKYQNNEQEIAKFYRRLDVANERDEHLGEIDRRKFGIYNYDKKNKLTNNTELEHNNGRS